MRTEERKRDRLKQALLSGPRPVHLLLVVIFVVLGIILVTQVRAQQTNPLESLSEDELVQLLAELDARESQLQIENHELESQLSELETTATQQEAANESVQRRQRQAEIAAGTVPVSGPGVILGVADPSKSLSPQGFVTTLAELRNAGAEAIELNDIRLTGRSWFASQGDQIVVDGQVLTSPYKWKAIGTPDTLALALEIRGGAAAQMRAYGATVTIVEEDNVRIDSVATPGESTWLTLEEEP